MRPSSAVTTLLRRLPPETAHRATLALLRQSSSFMAPPKRDPRIATALHGLRFASPIGIAAGFDKDAVALSGLTRLGLGFVEVGTVTPRPQPGNPKPRLFRLREDRALINRMGFNGGGLDQLVTRLERWRSDANADACPIGINIGVNKDSDDPPHDYAAGLTRVAPLADYVTVNVSSPNTPGLRAWQEGGALGKLLDALSAAHSRLAPCPPILIKLAPDLDDDALRGFVEAIRGAPIAGLILTNTTVTRPAGLRSRHRDEQGGLSGPPLASSALNALRTAFTLTGGRLPLIGVGGVNSAEAAYARIRAGASLIQLYTALVYRGPALIDEITTGLAARLAADGFTTLADAVGADHRTTVGDETRAAHRAQS
jgi:dihydroorotate dehydrogenase